MWSVSPPCSGIGSSDRTLVDFGDDSPLYLLLKGGVTGRLMIQVEFFSDNVIELR